MFGQLAPGLRAQASSAKQPQVWAWGRLPAQSQPGLLGAQGSGPEDGQRWPRGHLHPPPPGPPAVHCLVYSWGTAQGPPGSAQRWVQASPAPALLRASGLRPTRCSPGYHGSDRLPLAMSR